MMEGMKKVWPITQTDERYARYWARWDMTAKDVTTEGWKTAELQIAWYKAVSEYSISGKTFELDPLARYPKDMPVLMTLPSFTSGSKIWPGMSTRPSGQRYLSGSSAVFEFFLDRRRSVGYVVYVGRGKPPTLTTGAYHDPEQHLLP